MAVVKNVIFDLQARTGSAEKSLSKVEERLISLEKETTELRKDTTQYIEALKKLEQANDRLGRNTDGLNNKFNGLNGTLGRARQGFIQLAAVAGAGLGFQQIVGTIVDFDQALADLSAITGATGGDLKFYEEQARKIGTTTTVSASEAVQAFKLIGSAKPELLAAKEELVDLTNKAILLSEASGIELPQAAEQLGLALNALELPASSASRVIDVLALGSQKGTREIPFITDALSKFGAVAKNAGVEIETSVAAIEILGKAIPDASIAGTNMRGILIKLQDAAAKNGREFKGFVEEIELLKPRLNDVTFLTETFGQENFLAAQTLIGNVDALKQFELGLHDTGAAISQANTRTNTLQGDIKRLKNQWDETILSFANSGAIRSVFQFLTRNLPIIIKLVLLVAKAWIAYKTGVIATTVATKAYNVVQSLTSNGLVFIQRGFQLSTIATKAFSAALKTLLGVGIITFLYEAANALGIFGDKLDETQKKADQTKAREEARKKQNEISVQGVKDRLDAIDEANKVELSKLEEGSKERLAFEKRLNDEKLAIVNSEIETRKNIQKQFSDEEFKALQLSADDKLKLGIKSEEQLAALNKKAANDQKEINKEIALSQKEQIDELIKLQGDLQVVSNQSDREVLKSKKELSEEAKRQKESEKENARIVKEGTIAELQKRVQDLRETLTNDLRLDAANFSDVVEQYIKAQKDLEEATKRLGDTTEFAGLNTLAGLEKQLAELRKRLNEAPIGDIEEFFGVNKMIQDLEKKIKEARALLESEDKRAQLEKNLAIEDEEERHQSVMEGLIQDGKINEAEATRQSQREINRLIREGEIEQLEIRIAYAREKLKIMYESGEATHEELLRQEHELTEAQQELANKRAEFDKQDKEERLARQQEIVDGIVQIYTELFNVANQLLQNQIDLLDRQSEAQRNRISQAQRIAEDGNAELLQLEEERLDALNKKREQFVKAQQALSVLEVAANSAIAISKAAAEGGAAAPFTIAATLIALIAGLASARSAAQQASYEKGGYTGDGNPKSESRALGVKPYTYHKGEYVMDNKVTRIGRNKEIFAKIHRGRWDMEKVLNARTGGVAINNYSDRGTGEIVNAIKNIPKTSFHFNKHGIFSTVTKQNNYKKKVNNKL